MRYLWSGIRGGKWVYGGKIGSIYPFSMLFPVFFYACLLMNFYRMAFEAVLYPRFFEIVGIFMSDMPDYRK